eukprot:6194318-Pleurochrysis_carterae.AAC.2
MPTSITHSTLTHASAGTWAWQMRIPARCRARTAGTDIPLRCVWQPLALVCDGAQDVRLR